MPLRHARAGQRRMTPAGAGGGAAIVYLLCQAIRAPAVT
ncbi:hypothetical protein XCR_1790 [Xanthomonas campestris pv. raphani 756C]|nr:hypothetical protein XCR_1790 [Xanthomonas campestris pv. raphani 756C]